MKRVVVLFFTFALLVGPSRAFADDGGWLDWLYHMDPKFVGIGSELHVVCFDKDNVALPITKCDNLFRNVGRLLAGRRPINEIDLTKIRHEFDFRFAWYFKYGSTFHDVIDHNSAHAYKFMGMYHYHFDRNQAGDFQFGAGAGIMPFTGDFPTFTRTIVTPASLVWAPHPSSVLTLRLEYSYIGGPFSGAGFGNTASTYAKDHEHNVSFAVGYDLRRLPVIGNR